MCPCPRVTVRVAFLAVAKRRRRARRTTGIAAEGQLAARMCLHLEGGDRVRMALEVRNSIANRQSTSRERPQWQRRRRVGPIAYAPFFER
jgi:hypothetical protein